MLGTATRVLRLAFGGPGTAEADALDRQRLDFAAYAADSLLAGTLLLDADRLTDLLNATDEIELLDIVCLTLDGAVIQTDRASVRRSELLAVKAGQPRGNFSSVTGRGRHRSPRPQVRIWSRAMFTRVPALTLSSTSVGDPR